VDDAMVAPEELEGIDPVLEGVLAELAEQRVAHAAPGSGCGNQVLRHDLGGHLGSSVGDQESGSAAVGPARSSSGAGR